MREGVVPENVNVFIAGGYIDGDSRSLADARPFGGRDNFDGFYVVSGIEAKVSETGVLGFGFGYTNYSRAGVAKPIRFTTVAGPGPDPAAGAILGGAGCAVSARCTEIEAAVSRAKAGLSESFSRMTTETASRPAENRKGMRQPRRRTHRARTRGQ